MDNFKPEEIDKLIKKVLQDKLTRYISGKVTSELTKFHHTNKKPVKKELKEEAPTNSIGTSSSTSGTGSIDTLDPIISVKKKILKKRFDDLHSNQKD